MRKLPLLLILLCISVLSFGQRTKEGSVTITGANTVVNEFTALASDAAAGATTINVVNVADLNALGNFGSPFAAGDLIMIIQIQGAILDANTHPWAPPYYGLPNNTGWGAILPGGYFNTGNWEFAEVVAVSNPTITLSCPLQNSYTAWLTGNVQVVRVPRYDDLTISGAGSIATLAWNGVSRGIVAIEVSGTATINGGGITATGMGFRGGVNSDNNSLIGGGFFSAQDDDQGAEKGEGVAGYQADYFNMGGRYGKGAAANAGGGGTSHNAGGGGGANAGFIANWNNGVGVPDPAYNAAWALETPPIAGFNSDGGGRGGYTFSSSDNDASLVVPGHSDWQGDNRRNQGGLGGRPLDYSTGRLFLGGGGGAGDQNDNAGGDGGAGGGLIYILSYGDINGSGVIASNGAAGQNTNTGNGGADGAGGAGAGGTVVVNSLGTIAGTLTINANGGAGGDQILLNAAVGEAEGPGGGGGGGYIAISGGGPARTANGGVYGTTNSTHFNEMPPNGATSGGTGQPNESITNFSVEADDDTICGGGSTTLTAIINGTLPGGTVIGWYDSDVGGSLLGVGSTYTTPVLATTTTYYIGTCPGHYRDTVTVFVSPLINITNVATTDPTCADNDGQIIITASGGSGTLMYSIDNGVTLQASNTFGGLSGATYDIVVEDENGCTSGTQVTLTTPPAPTLSNIAVTDPTCAGGDGQIVITATGGTTPYQYSIDNGVTFQAGNTFGSLGVATYDIVVLDAAGCTVAAQVTLVPTSGPSINGTTPADPVCNGDNNGSIIVNASGGTTPLQYSDDNGVTFQAGSTFSGLPAGTYDIVVEDATGCQTTIQVVLTDPPAVSITNVATTDPTCNGDTDGSIIITAGGGTGALQYSIDNGVTFQGSNTFNTLGGGTYDIVVEDASGCSATTQVTLTNPTAVTISNVATTDPLCNGNANGTIVITAGGGVGLIQYSIDNGVTFQASNTFNGLVGNTYDIIVEDANGCSASTQVTLTDPPAVTITNVATTDPLCSGDSNGSIIITAGGGTGSLQYSIDNGVTFQGSNTFNTVGGGTYDIVVEDANGCTAGTQVVLTNPLPVTIVNVATTDPSCNGDTDGSIVVTAGGGTGALQYSIDNGVTFQGGGTFNTLGDGTYDIVLEDANGCTAGQQVVLTEPPAIVISNVATVDPSCGNNDGSIIITASGGTGALQYSIDNGVTFQAGSSFPNLAASSYTIVVEDATGCTATTSVSLNNTSGPTIDNITSTDPTCAGGTDGSIDVTTSGGTTPYQFSDDNGVTFQGSNIFGSLGAGTYDIVVEDAIGCQATIQVVLTDPPAVTITNVATTDPTCNGDTDGTIDITAGGGTGALQYSIDNGVTFQAGNTFGSLADGTYDIVVEDANGCSATTQVVITEPTVVAITNTSTVDPTCGNTDGSIDITAGGGTGALQYSIDNGVTFQAGNVFSNLGAGTYDIVVEDANGCSATLQLILNSANGPSITSSSFTDPLCNGDANGTIDITASGGTSPLQYSSDNGVTFQAGNTFSGLPAGTYDMVVEDAGGCQFSVSITLTDPLAITVSNVTITDASCSASNGEIDITGVGGTGALQYSIDNGVTFQSSGVFSGLPTGSYDFIITDANGCTAASGPHVVNDAAGPTVTFTADVTSGCSDLTVSFSNTTVGGTQFDWDFGDSNTSTDENPTHTYTTPGIYDVILVVTDAGGCSGTDTLFAMIEVFANPIAAYTAAPNPAYIDNPTVVFTDNSSTDVNFWFWDFGDSNSSLSQNASHTFGAVGTYTVCLVVNNTDGCVDTACSSIIILDNVLPISIPNVFTPDGNGINDNFVITNLPENYHVRIYNRWGQLMFNAENYQNNWDGTTSSGNQVPEGTYYYLIVSADGDEYNGPVTLVRE